MSEQSEMNGTKCKRDGWVKKKLGEVCDTTSGGTPAKSKSEYYDNGTIPWLRSGEVCNKYIEDTEIKITEDGLNHSSAKWFPINTVVLAMYGATVGQVGILKNEMTTNQAVCGIFPNSNLIPEFLYYFFTSHRNYYIQQATGGAQPNISQTIIKNTEILFPSISEQQRIVSELDCLNGIIEKQKEQLKQLDELAQSIFYDMFGDPVENEKGWNKKKFKEFGTIISGYAFQSGSFVEEGIPVLKIGNINSGQLSLENVCYYSEDKSLIKYEVYPNDMVISLTGTVGKDDYGNVCVLPNTCSKYYLNQRNAKLVTDGNCEILFLKFLFKDTKVKNELTKNSRGVRQANISNKDIYGLSLILPPLPLQQAFAQKIEAIEHQKELIKQSLVETETLFNSRMDYYFT